MSFGYSVIMTSSDAGETLFRWLITLYVSIRSPLCLRQYREYKLRCSNLVSYGSFANPGTNLVALCCTRSSLSMFLTKYGFQIEAQYSKCGRMCVLYNTRNDSLVKWVKVLFIRPRDCMALAEALSHCSVKSGGTG